MNVDIISFIHMISRYSSLSKIRRNILFATYYKRIFEYKIKRKVLAFPSIFCIQTINACNGSCIMCPISKNIDNKSFVMSNSLFKKIIKEISQEKLRFTFIYLFLQNEPFLDKDIFTKIRLIRNICNEKIKIGLVTNGTLITNEKIKELEKYKVDELIFSLDALYEETYKKIRQGLNFNHVIRNIQYVIDSDFNGYLGVKFVRQKDNISELDIFKKFWKEKGIFVQISDLNNRSGDLKIYKDLSLKNRDNLNLNNGKYVMKDITITSKRFKGCPTPIITFNILYDGKVILCCDDFNKKMILGDINNSTIKEIWNSKQYENIRKMLYKGEYKKIPVCCNCNKII